MALTCSNSGPQRCPLLRQERPRLAVVESSQFDPKRSLRVTHSNGRVGWNPVARLLGNYPKIGHSSGGLVWPEADWLLWSRGGEKSRPSRACRGYQPSRRKRRSSSRMWGHRPRSATAAPARASVSENEGRSQPGRIEPSYKAYGRLRVLGRPGVTDFDPLGQKLQEDADPDRQEPTLPKIDGMQFVEVAGVEFLENRDKPIGGDIVLDDE